MNGKVEWIGIRPERRGTVISLDRVHISKDHGLEGDHDTKSHRQVTVISKEALDDVAHTLGKSVVDPRDTRRNIVISGLEFDKLENAHIQIGEAIIEVTGICHPCQLMNQNLGEGGRDAMSGYRGGFTARVVQSGDIAIGDQISV